MNRNRKKNMDNKLPENNFLHMKNDKIKAGIFLNTDKEKSMAISGRLKELLKSLRRGSFDRGKRKQIQSRQLGHRKA